MPPVPARYETTLTDAQLASIRYLYLAAHTSHSAPIMFLRQFMPGDLDGLTGVQRLNVSHNGFLEHALPGAPRWFLAQLEVLYIPNMALNRITDADFFEGLTNLRELDVQRNNLTYELPGNPNRPEPTAVGPLINPEAWSRLPNLRKLKIGSNRILTLPRGFFRHLTRLEELDMFDMWYEYHPYGFGSQALPAGIFEGLRRLRKLDLGYNAIGAAPVDDGLFDGLSAIREIDLTRNPLLRRLPRGVLDLPEGVVIRTDPGVLWPDESNGNQAATGLPRIIGSARIGETLSVDLSGIEDENGLPTTFRYQWRKNSESIPGARGPTFTVTADEVTAKLRVTVSFTDGDGNAETVTSIETSPVPPAQENVATVDVSFASATISASEGGPAATVHLDLDTEPGRSVVIPLTVRYGNGASAQDLSTIPTSITFNAVQTRRSITVIAVDDADDDDGESVTVSLGTLPYAVREGSPASVTISLVDDDGPAVEPAALTASFEAVPESHDGRSAFTARIRFSEAVRTSYVHMRDIAVQAHGGTVRGARQVGGNSARWEITVEPDSDGDVTVVVPSDRPCDESGAICTGDGRRLSNRLEATIAGPASPADEVAPALSSATIDGTMLTLTFSEALDEDSAPAAGTFAVSVGGRARGVSGVSVSGSAVVLTLASAVTAGEAVTVGYTVPTTAAAPRIEDEAGNDAAAFSGEAVTNSTSAPVNTPPTGLPAISGTAHVGETLTASASRIADADGLSGATFAWQWIANDGTGDTNISGATEASHTLDAGDAGKTVKVRGTFTDDGGTEETLVSAATEPVAIPLTARFEDVPETHDGSTRFTFDLRFSEEIPLSYKTLRDRSLEVVGGTVRGARRLARPSNMRWRITVEPDTEGDLTITLPADRACNTAGAICTSGGKRLSSRLEATVAGPASPTLPKVSIAAGASPVAEGTAAAFTLSRNGDTAAALTVAVVVAEDGAALKGTSPASVTFAPGAGTAELAVATDDDETAESASTVTATVEGGDGYAVDADAASASVTVEDDDAAPVVTTATPIDTPENGTTVATLVATDADTPAADLAWSIAGGADADKFTLTAAGALAFKAAPDFETPDDAGADGEYEVTVAVTDGANPVEAELTVRLTDVDDVAPVLAGASVDGATVTLTFNEALDEGSLPPAGAFAITVGTASREVSDVSVGGTATLLTLASPVTADETVEVTYSVPAQGSVRIRDTAGNAVAGFSGQAVTNATPVANTLPTGQPAIAGTARVGETLTASADGIEDADGLAGTVFAWQWIANTGTGDVDIEGATQASYTLTAGEAGKTVKVRVTFTDDGGTEETLVSAATATVPAPLPEVSIAAAASPVTEGDAAVFVLRRSGDTTSALTVAVSVSEAGDVLDVAAPSSVDFAENASEARLRIATEDDDAAEADARVTVTVAAGSGYRVDAAARAAGVDVFDDDEAPSGSTATLWSVEMEVGNYGGWLGTLGGALDGNGWTENGVDYAIDHIIHVLDELLVGFTTAPEDVDGLAMHLGEVKLALASAGSGASYSWSNVELGWEAGMTVPVRLTRRTEAPVAGPGVSVADARVREAEGASLKFRVTLATPQTSTVSVRYATSDGTAVAGEDYAGVSGALRFAPGENAKTVEVAVFDDAHDEGAETLTLTLSRPFGARLSHAQATGTIANTDPMPRAWLARFGRTVAEHVVEAVDERLTAPREAPSQVTIAGLRVDLEGNAREWDAAEARAARDALEILSGRRPGDVEGRDAFGDSIFARHGAGSDTSRALTARELLTRSAFHFASEGSGEEGRLTVWGRGAWSGFSGRDDDLSLDGDVATGMVGADFGRDGWLGGLMLSHSQGSGTYTTDGSGSSGRSEGEIDSSLTGLYPYLGLDLTERMSVWGVGGYGQGALTLTREGEAPLETDIDMTMAAGGMRGDVLDAGETGGFGLALKSDALFVRTASEAVPGLAAAEADVSRLRLGLEGSYELALGAGGTLVPSLEAAVRQDGGDAETGLGVELGSGLRYEDPSRGLSSELNLRGLVAHEDGSYEEWGASGSLRYEPGGSSDLGPSLTLAQSWGAPSTGGMESLLGRHTMAGIAVEDAYTPGARLDAELGYGLSVLDGRGVAIPHVGMSRGDDGRTLLLGQRLRLGSSSEWSLEGEFPENGRTVRLGYRYGFGRSFDLSVEAERRASGAGDGAPEHGLWLRASRLW